MEYAWFRAELGGTRKCTGACGLDRAWPGVDTSGERSPVWGGSGSVWGDTLTCSPTVEKIRATFTILRAFGCVSTGHSCHATRFAMVMSLDFNATGRVTAAQLQVRPLGDGRGGSQPHSAEPTPPGMCLSGHGSRGRGVLSPNLTQRPRTW